jgi:hypothetical protein
MSGVFVAVSLRMLPGLKPLPGADRRDDRRFKPTTDTPTVT